MPPFLLLSLQHNTDLGLNPRWRYDIPYLQCDLRLIYDMSFVNNLDLVSDIRLRHDLNTVRNLDLREWAIHLQWQSARNCGRYLNRIRLNRICLNKSRLSKSCLDRIRLNKGCRSICGNFWDIRLERWSTTPPRGWCYRCC